MTPYGVTPVISQHARERCAEMGISTKIAKWIWRSRMLTRPVSGAGERVLVMSPEFPDYILIVATAPSRSQSPEGKPLVVTVAFNCDDSYVRVGTGYRVTGP